MERISWNEYFMAQSHLLALRSTCERLSVGATIVRDKRIIAGGYNGSVSGSVHCVDEGCYIIDGHCVRTIHAEINALLQCSKFGVPTDGAEIYVTHFPCVHCCKSIIQSGIQKVYYAEDYKNHPYAIQLFKEAGVDTEKVEVNPVELGDRSAEKTDFVYQLLNRLQQTSNQEDFAELERQANKLFSSTTS
ncbi:competence protein ComE [Pontibacillus halophilus JSM 076056 = DSM 19796]|uniref:ComE operon protein 2 n=1 Tax=Pontibacillus halophilus JSM 076056 = DSM 19796 TaxID=1385510 RepID=A0A0A5GJY0_9BACI|nr:ComE operon protein 2 [Pontibacillus halophilus]KGX93561.1 competence protein ComE [Pontibacillus halophilus JSM 076056 = DSM 19796]